MERRHYEPLVRDVPMMSEEHLLDGARKLGARFISSLVMSGNYVAVQMQDSGERNDSGKQDLCDGLKEILRTATNMSHPEVSLYIKENRRITISAWTEHKRDGGGIEGYLTIDADLQIPDISIFEMYSQKELKR